MESRSDETRRWNPAFAVVVAICLIAISCGGDGSGGDQEEVASPSRSSGVPMDEAIADNGYGDITLGRSLSDLRDQYGDGAFVEVGILEGDGVEAVVYRASNIHELEFTFVDGVLRRVEVTAAGVPSINGNHEVGDPVGSVLDRYQERIDDGETLAVNCSDEAVIARARDRYRLVFYRVDGQVSRIASLDRGHVEPGVPCSELDGPPADEVVVVDEPEDGRGDDDAPDPEPPLVTVDDFVPERLLGEEILVRNPSTDQLAGPYALLWSAATQYHKGLEIIDVVSSVMQCLYDGDPPAVAVGVYQGQIVVAVAAQHVATLQNAGCVLIEVIINACPFCLMAGPAVDGYLVDIGDVTYAIGYGTLLGGGPGLEAMCAELPHCADTTFDTIPAEMLATG